MNTVFKSKTLKFSDSMKVKVNEFASKIDGRFPLIGLECVAESEPHGKVSVSIKAEPKSGGFFQSSSLEENYYSALSSSCAKITRELEKNIGRMKSSKQVKLTAAADLDDDSIE